MSPSGLWESTLRYFEICSLGINSNQSYETDLSVFSRTAASVCEFVQVTCRCIPTVHWMIRPQLQLTSSINVF